MKIERRGRPGPGLRHARVSRVDGNDPVHRAAALDEAVERARTGGGPTLLECLTFRFHGHYFGDPMGYIPKEQLAAARAADPVPAVPVDLLVDGRLHEIGARRHRGSGQATRSRRPSAAALAAAPPRRSTSSTRDVYANPHNCPAREVRSVDEREMTMREALNLALDQALGRRSDASSCSARTSPTRAVGTRPRACRRKHGTDRVLDTPISEAAIVGAAIGAGARRAPAGGRDHDHGLHRHRRSTRSSTTRPSRGSCPAAGRRRRSRSAPQVFGGLGTGGHPLPVAGGLVHAHAGSQGDRAVARPRDAKGLLTIGDLRRRPVPLRRDHQASGAAGSRPARPRLRHPRSDRPR